MRKISLKTRVAAIAAAALLSASATSFAADTIDFGVMVPEETYEFSAFSVIKGEYTPTESGIVKIEYTPSLGGMLYTSPEHGDDEQVYGDFAFADGKQVMNYNLEIGTTYYLYGKPMDSGKLVIHEGEVQLAVSSIIPDPADGPFSVSSDYRMEVTFNYPVSVGNVFLIAGDARERVTTLVSNTTVTCDVANVVMEMYHQGTLKEGDELTLRILQIRDASDENVKFDDNGKLEITYTVCGKPAELVSLENADLNGGSVMNSYYVPEDPDAKVRFRFDRELSTEIMPAAHLSYGDSDNLDVGVYNESIPGLNSGETATFDFSGRLRRPIDMLPLSTPETQPASLHVSFANIYTPDGQRAYTGMMSNPTGYSVSFRINVLQYNIAADFTPARGTALRPGQNLEIWVMNGSKIAFDAVCFDYEEEGEAKTAEVPAGMVAKTADEFSDDDMIFTLQVPDIKADGTRGIDVYFKNLVCADGLDHSNDIFGDFKSGSAALDEIGAERPAYYTVYDVTGTLVLKNGSRSDLAKLAKGLYIVNGKKISIL